jgi:GT2 family glycosyltransferase
MPIMPQILAVIVLYRMTADESTSFASIQTCRSTSPELANAYELMVWDNTPGRQVAPKSFAGSYIQAGDNPGLAVAYNAALSHAAARGAPWLMLLDQDTVVTEQFLMEALALARTSRAGVLVPRLTWHGRTLSPFRPIMVGPPLPLEDTVLGECHEPLQAFNSGAVFSVEQLQQAGGFDTDFPIDYLDHATFKRLQARGGLIHVLHSRLEHALASQAPGPLSDGALCRERDILNGERRYFRKYGTTEEQRLFKLRLLRRAASVLFHKHDLRNARMILRTLLGLMP